jgi:hypothetical protein
VADTRSRKPPVGVDTLGRRISGHQEQIVLLDLLDQEYRCAMKRCNPLRVLGVDGEEVGRYVQLPMPVKNFWVDSVAAPVRVSIPYTPVRRTAVLVRAPSLRRFNPTN